MQCLAKRGVALGTYRETNTANSCGCMAGKSDGILFSRFFPLAYNLPDLRGIYCTVLYCTLNFGTKTVDDANVTSLTVWHHPSVFRRPIVVPVPISLSMPVRGRLFLRLLLLSRVQGSFHGSTPPAGLSSIFTIFGI